MSFYKQSVSVIEILTQIDSFFILHSEYAWVATSMFVSKYTDYSVNIAESKVNWNK